MEVYRLTFQDFCLGKLKSFETWANKLLVLVFLGNLLIKTTNRILPVLSFKCNFQGITSHHLCSVLN